MHNPKTKENSYLFINAIRDVILKIKSHLFCINDVNLREGGTIQFVGINFIAKKSSHINKNYRTITS